MGFIYKVVNNINGKIYIGKTSRTIKVRWKEHVRDSYKPQSKAYTSILHFAIRKYGEDSFTISQVEECNNADLNDKEKYWIEFFKSYENGYNISHGGEGWLKCSDDDIIKLWESGESVMEISNHLKLCQGTVSRRLKCLGVDKLDIIARGNQRARKKRLKPIYQYDIDGNYIREFSSLEDAEQSIDGQHIKPNQIKHKLFGGYQWRRFKVDKIESARDIKKEGNPKMVYQYDMDGNYIRSFISAKEAADHLGKKSFTSINKNCLGKSRHAFGYRWSYEYDNLPKLKPDGIRKKVIRISDNGDEKLYNSITLAAKDNDISTGDIVNVCKGIHHKTAGYYWKYASD